MTKTTLWIIAFSVIGVANLILLIPIALFALFCMGDFSLDGYDPPLSFTQKEVEAIGKERCHLSGMTFPEDMTYMNGEYDYMIHPMEGMGFGFMKELGIIFQQNRSNCLKKWMITQPIP